MDIGFLLKKIISIFLMPLPIGIFLGLIGLFYLFRSQEKKGKQWIVGSMVWLFIFSYAPVANLLLHTIESRYPTLHQASPQIRFIYILGHGHTTSKDLPITSQLSKEAVVRVNEGIRLYYQLHGEAKLILSGYNGLLDPTSHAKMQEKLATALGVPKEDLIILPDPKDTQEEAQKAKEICQNDPLVIVTSAYHMPRAMRWFQRSGLHPIPAPTYHQSSITHLNYFNIFSADALLKSTIVFHEFLGMLWQKIKGV